MKILVSWLFLFLAIPVTARAAYDPALDRTIAESREILKRLVASPDQSIPIELLAKCKAIAIYPSVLRAGFIAGARYGHGVVLRRDKGTGKWGAVSFSKVGGVSAGLQVGIQATDLILVVMNNHGLDSLLGTRFALGAGIGASIGPVGRNTEIATDLALKAGILAYSQSRGLFGGLMLDGTVVMPDDGANAAYYGKPLSQKDILLGDLPAQSSSLELIADLQRYSAYWSEAKAKKAAAMPPARPAAPVKSFSSPAKKPAAKKAA